jgi:hypothetical protein
LRIGKLFFYAYPNGIAPYHRRFFECRRYCRGRGGLCRPLRAHIFKRRDHRALIKNFQKYIEKVPTGDVYADAA